MQKNSVTTNTQNGAGNNSSGNGSTIFIHVVFAVVVLAQLLLLERRLFRLRAERYAYLHPGEMLPTSRRPANTSMGISPWQRPSLPTYAAALNQSGHGTGDVEDHIIAVAPPPAYGQTRDSRLLLSGFLRNSLRAQRPVSMLSQISQRDETQEERQEERPLSYASHELWQNASTARTVEEALATLEAGGGIPMVSTSTVTRASVR